MGKNVLGLQIQVFQPVSSEIVTSSDPRNPSPVSGLSGEIDQEAFREYQIALRANSDNEEPPIPVGFCKIWRIFTVAWIRFYTRVTRYLGRAFEIWQLLCYIVFSMLFASCTLVQYNNVNEHFEYNKGVSFFMVWCIGWFLAMFFGHCVIYFVFSCVGSSNASPSHSDYEEIE